MPEDHAVEDGSRKFMTCSVTVFSGAEARSIGQSSTRARSFPSSNGFGRTSVGIGTEEGPSRSGRLRSLAMHEAQSLEFLDPAVARGDRDPEAAAEVNRGCRAVERSQEDACRILVHDRPGHLQGFYGSYSRLSERMRATRPVISSASNGLFRYPVPPRRTLSISLKVCPNALLRVARSPGSGPPADPMNPDDVRPRLPETLRR